MTAIVNWLLEYFGSESRTIHELKSCPDQFECLAKKEMRHDVRRFDRDFRAGDWVMLREWDPAVGNYTGNQVFREITHITAPGTFGLPDDIGVLSLR